MSTARVRSTSSRPRRPTVLADREAGRRQRVHIVRRRVDGEVARLQVLRHQRPVPILAKVVRIQQEDAIAIGHLHQAVVVRVADPIRVELLVLIVVVVVVPLVVGPIDLVPVVVVVVVVVSEAAEL